MTHLDDNTAIRILQTIAQARLRPAAPDLLPTPDLLAALTDAIGNPPPVAPSEGDLARAALALLAEYPTYAGPIEMMARQPAPGRDRFIDPTSIALTTAALLVLQSYVKVKRDAKGHWTFEAGKKSLSDGALKPLIQHLISLLGG